MSHGATARLFVAVDPPAWVREELADWARRVAAQMRAAGVPRDAMRLLDADSLHLTLCFLGSRPVAEIDALAAAVEMGLARATVSSGSRRESPERGPVEHASEVSIGAPLWLPPRRPHALAVEINDRGGALTSVQQQLSQALANASGWEPERRRFRAHITVARVRGNALGATRRRRRRSFRDSPVNAVAPVLTRTASAGSSATAGPRAAQGGRHGAGPTDRHADAARAAAPTELPLPATPQLGFSPPEVVLYRSWLVPAGASYEALARGALEQHAG